MKMSRKDNDVDISKTFLNKSEKRASIYVHLTKWWCIHTKAMFKWHIFWLNAVASFVLTIIMLFEIVKIQNACMKWNGHFHINSGKMRSLYLLVNEWMNERLCVHLYVSMCVDVYWIEMHCGKSVEMKVITQYKPFPLYCNSTHIKLFYFLMGFWLKYRLTQNDTHQWNKSFLYQTYTHTLSGAMTWS